MNDEKHSWLDHSDGSPARAVWEWVEKRQSQRIVEHPNGCVKFYAMLGQIGRSLIRIPRPLHCSYKYGVTGNVSMVQQREWRIMMHTK